MSEKEIEIIKNEPKFLIFQNFKSSTVTTVDNCVHENFGPR